MPLSWPADKAARHIFAKLKDRPLEIAFPALFMAACGPVEAARRGCNWRSANAWCAAPTAQDP
jgi:hypothetical protein